MKAQCQNPKCGKGFEAYHPKDKFHRTACRVAAWRDKRRAANEKAGPITIEGTLASERHESAVE